MKKTIALLFAFITILSMSACRIEKVYDNKQPKQTYELPLSGFSSISNNSNCDIHFTQSNTYKVTLKASKQWYDTHNIIVKGGTLKISLKKTNKEKGVTILNFTNYDSGAELWISAPSLSYIGMYGSGDIIAENDLNGENLQIEVAGSGSTTLKGVSLSGDIEYSVAGSGDVQTGLVKAKNAKFYIAGSGSIKTGLEKVDKTEVSVAGSGEATVNFNNCGFANVEVAGSGDITLSGQLKRLDKDVAGSGDIDTTKLQISK